MRVCVCVCVIFMIGAVPQAHGLEFRLTEQPMNCSCSRLVSRALAIGGATLFNTVCGWMRAYVAVRVCFRGSSVLK